MGKCNKCDREKRDLDLSCVSCDTHNESVVYVCFPVLGSTSQESRVKEERETHLFCSLSLSLFSLLSSLFSLENCADMS